MNTRVHRPLKIVAFNANGITQQRYEFSKQLQTRRIDVALLSETHLKPHERFPLQTIIFIGMTATRVQKVEMRLQSEKESHILM
jgi:exonuclease III